jgi:hypothetical protein
MAWTTAPAPGQLIASAVIADIIAKQSSWGGNVAANSNSLTGVNVLSAASLVLSSTITGVTTIQTSGAVGIGRAATKQLDVYVAGAAAEAIIESGVNNDSGLIIKDPTRSWKVGVNVASAGSGKLTFYNFSTAASLLTMGDSDIRLGASNITISSSLPGPYADNSAAVSAGLTAGRLYRDSTNNIKQVQ